MRGGRGERGRMPGSFIPVSTASIPCQCTVTPSMFEGSETTVPRKLFTRYQ